MPFSRFALLRAPQRRRVSREGAPTTRTLLRHQRRLRNQRVKAVLAGGLVFGVGATATIASWTDTEAVDGSFESGTFNIEVGVNGTWDNTREMKFEAAAMYPGAKVYAPVFVRTTANTTMTGKLTASGEGISGTPNTMGTSLTYRTVTRAITAGDVSSFSCGSGSFSGSDSFVFGTSTAGIGLRTAAKAPVSQSLKPAGASVQAYCFEVTLPTNTANAAQGQSANHTWTFDAESTPTGS